MILFFFFFSSRRRHTRFDCDWSSDVCSSDLGAAERLEPSAWKAASQRRHDRGGVCVPRRLARRNVDARPPPRAPRPRGGEGRALEGAADPEAGGRGLGAGGARTPSGLRPPPPPV